MGTTGPQPMNKKEKEFVDLASQHLSLLKQEGADSLPPVADHLVQAGLTLALGSGIAKEPEAFNKMKAAIQKKIMTNPEYRQKLEKFVSILEKFDKK
jgi:hypothetical protein